MAAGYAIAVHGGAGEVEDARAEVARAGCRRAALAGLAVLAAGGSALEAVCAAVVVLEDDPEFNAGRGAVLDREGRIEHDAAVMTGDLRVGACAVVSGVKNPIELARSIRADGEHVLLVGAGALAFADEKGVPRCDPSWHMTDRAREKWAQRRAASALPEAGGGTVGAVARDAAGQVAAATSTGGITNKRPGRVGDTPLPGCGTYADERAGAASATGPGEAIIRTVMGRGAVDRLRSPGLEAGVAAREACAEVLARTGGEVGILVLGLAGPPGVAHASRRMSWATGGEGLPLETGVEAGVRVTLGR